MNAFLLFSIDSVCIKHSCEMCQMFNHHKNRPCNHTFVFARAEIGRHRFARGQGIRNVLIRYVTAFCVLPSFSQIVCDIDAFYVSLPSFNHFQFVGCALTQCRPLSLSLSTFDMPVVGKFALSNHSGSVFISIDGWLLWTVWARCECLFRKLNAYAHQNGIQYSEQFTFWNANSDDEDEAARRIDEQQNNELNTSLAYHR